MVRGASRIAKAIGISPLVVGLTVVAFGTSAPELAVSVKASLAGQGNIAIGNIVGSNLMNVLFILGISAIIVPLIVNRQLVRLDVPVMIGASLLMWGFGLDGSIARIEGFFLFAGSIVYSAYILRISRKEQAKILTGNTVAEFVSESRRRTMFTSIVIVLIGLAMLTIGARWLVRGAVDFATILGISNLVIGLTVVAVGTSLPEVVTSIVASLRHERDIAVGNIVGSNIFNILVVLGITSTVSQNGVVVAKGALNFDIPIMVAAAVACLPVFFTDGKISRWEGFVFLGYYVAYILYIVLQATNHSALPSFRDSMLWFVIPLTIIGISLSFTNALCARGRRKK